MNAHEAKHQAQLAEWKELVMDCRSSGMTVRAWCNKQQISYKTYYRWEREVLEIASAQFANSPALDVSPVFAELSPPESDQTPQPKTPIVASVRLSTMTIDVYAGADTEAIAALCRSLSYVE